MFPLLSDTNINWEILSFLLPFVFPGKKKQIELFLGTNHLSSNFH